MGREVRTRACSQDWSLSRFYRLEAVKQVPQTGSSGKGAREGSSEKSLPWQGGPVYGPMVLGRVRPYGTEPGTALWY